MYYPKKLIPEIYIHFEDNSEEALTFLLDDADPAESDGNAELEKPVTDPLIHDGVNFPQG